MKIVIESKTEDQLRYKTFGDWFYQDGVLHIQVLEDLSEMDKRLIALHELCEAILCESVGITQQQVDDFDFANAEYAETYEVELGDMANSPYGKQHRQSMLIEHLMAQFLGIKGYGVVK